MPPRLYAVSRSIIVLWLAACFVSEVSAYAVINIADGRMRANGGPLITFQSNAVAYNVSPPVAARMEIMQHAGDSPEAETVPVSTSQCGPVNGPYVTLGSTVTTAGFALEVPGPVELQTTRVVKRTDPIFFRVTDFNANPDPLVIDTVAVFLNVGTTGQRVEILIRETGVNTGVFTGYALLDACGLNIGLNTEVTIEYTDPTDPGDDVSASVIVDPFGRVFDSVTGAMIDGAVVTLINEDTGLPAQVFSDDGVSGYPSTVTSGGTVVDAVGNRFDLGPGEYRFPFVAPGRYRLVVVPPPGYRHPSVVGNDELQALFSAPFEIVLGSRGEIFVVNPGPALEIDIPLDPLDGAPFVTKRASKSTMSIGDLVEYVINVSGADPNRDLDDVVVTDNLPQGFRVRESSIRIDGDEPAPGLVDIDGRIVRIRIGDVPAGTSTTVRYVAEAAAGSKTGEAVNTAFASTSTGLSSNVASATITVTDDLFRDRSLILGRVVVDSCDGDPASDEQGLGGVGIYLEDGTYVVSDTDGRYHFEGVRPGTHVVQLDPTTIDEQFRVVPCLDNTRTGDGYSQFVQSSGAAPWRADFHVETIIKPGATAAAPAESSPGDEGFVASLPAFNRDWLQTQGPEYEFVYPDTERSPPIPSTHILIKHAPGQRPELQVNGKDVGALNFDTTWTNPLRTAALSHWRGVDLIDGDNVVSVRLLDRDKRVVSTSEHIIHYSTAPITVELVPELSTLVADGRTLSRVAVRLRDKDGYPARAGIGGHYSLEPPYRPYRSMDEDARRALNIIPDERPAYRVGDDGIAYLHIEPTNESGEIVAALSLDETIEREVRTWMATPVRDWILVGLAEGTLAHRKLSDHVEQLPPGMSEGYDADGRVAFFARGRIRGKWLLTLAYDSARKTGEASDSLRQQIDPDEYYSVYADASEQRTHAPSAGKLYVRLERETFFAVLGDYETGLTITELARYNRSLHGVKSGYRGKNVSYSVFGAHTDNQFVKDEIRGDGTSGLYALSARDLVTNSEKITLETRDRFHPERVIRAQHLTRYIDYSIDYRDGTIFFKQPVPTRDFDFNPVFIVVDYESGGSRNNDIVAGGRVAAHLLENRLEAGVSGIYEGATGNQADLQAVDITYRPDIHTTIRAEAARSGKEATGGREHGTAYLVEAERSDGKLDARAYFRRQSESFGVGQQRGSESGTEKFGGELEYALDEKWRLDLEAFRQRGLETERYREVVEARANYRLERGNLYSGLRWARDAGDGEDPGLSVNALAGGSRSIFSDRVLLRLSSEISVAGKNDNPDYPTRVLGGADYRFSDALTFFAEHELTAGAERDTHDTRIGTRSTPWRGAQATSSIGRAISDSGDRIFSNSGFIQRWQLNERWSVDASIDRSTTISENNYIPLNINVPPASGTLDEDADYSALSAGVNYRLDNLLAFSRWELRMSDRSDRASVGLGMYRELTDGVAYSGNFDTYIEARANGERDVDGELSLGLAWRPSLSRWLVLNRGDFSYERRDRTGESNKTYKFVANTHAQYQWREHTSIAGRLGAKLAHDVFETIEATAVTTLAGMEMRHDLSPRVDIGIHGDVLRSWKTGTMDYSLGASVGFSPIDNTWIVAGYNVSGFDDEDFAAGQYLQRGPYVSLRLKIDQNSARSLRDWLSGRVATQRSRD